MASRQVLSGNSTRNDSFSRAFRKRKEMIEALKAAQQSNGEYQKQAVRNNEQQRVSALGSAADNTPITALGAGKKTTLGG